MPLPTGSVGVTAGRALRATIGVALILLASSSAPQTPASAPAARMEALVPLAWWNKEENVRTLALSAEQRAGMDERLRVHLRERQRLQARTEEARRWMVDALERGAWVEARRQSAELAEDAAAQSRSQAALMVSVLELLSVQQRARFVQHYRHLLLQPWIRSARVGRGNAGR